MKWHSVKERLPENRPIKGKRLVPDFNWVPVTNGKGVWAMARYSLKVVRGKTTPTWEFWPGLDIHETSCPKRGDMKTGFLTADQITHWLDIWLDLPVIEDDDNLLISNADQDLLCKKVHKALYNQFMVNQGYTFLHDPDYDDLKEVGKTYDKAAVKAVVDTLIYLGYKIEKNLASGCKEVDQEE